MARLFNPYLDLFRALPAEYRRDPSKPIIANEAWSVEWLRLKAAIAGHYAWAVPTDEAIGTIRKYANSLVEIGAGSGYWAWLMRQAGMVVAAFDANPPAFSWSSVAPSDERAVIYYPHYALFLCWPPWNSDMALNALALYRGKHVAYVGEWMGGSANPQFFQHLASTFELIEAVDIPQWQYRNDRLLIFQRRKF